MRPDELDQDDEDLLPVASKVRQWVLLLAVLGGTVGLSTQLWPDVSYWLQAGEPTQCGAISRRPELGAGGAETLPHGVFCELSGVVQLPTILATGRAASGTTAEERDRGRRFFVKLDGDKVFAALPGERSDLQAHRQRHGSLVGFGLRSERGRLFDPEREPGYASVGRALRTRFSLPEGQAIRIFDATDLPADRWPAALALVMTLLTGALAVFGLARLIYTPRR